MNVIMNDDRNKLYHPKTHKMLNGVTAVEMLCLDIYISWKRIQNVLTVHIG